MCKIFLGRYYEVHFLNESTASEVQWLDKSHAAGLSRPVLTKSKVTVISMMKGNIWQTPGPTGLYPQICAHITRVELTHLCCWTGFSVLSTFRLLKSFKGKINDVWGWETNLPKQILQKEDSKTALAFSAEAEDSVWGGRDGTPRTSSD